MELAASVQLCVEGELGHLADAPRYDQAANADLMTQPTDVAEKNFAAGRELFWHACV